jgi:hypothetical protein
LLRGRNSKAPIQRDSENERFFDLKLHARLEDTKLNNRDIRDELQTIAVKMSEGAFPLNKQNLQYKR